MIWKELFHPSAPRRRWTVLVAVVLLVFLSFVPPIVIVFKSFHPSWRDISEEFNMYVRVIGTSVACVGMLGAGIRAAGSVRIERDKETFDSLLTCPLATDEILYAKWLGSLWAMRWLAVWLGAIWLIGVISGGLHPFAFPVLAALCFVYAGTLAMVGLWFSVISRSSGRATVATLLASLGLIVGHWLIWMCCAPLGISTGMMGPGRALEELAKLQMGFTPPVVLGFLVPWPWRTGDYIDFRGGAGGFMFGVFVGTAAWIAIGFIVWNRAHARFRQIYNRGKFIVPESPKPMHLKPAINDAAQPAPVRGD